MSKESRSLRPNTINEYRPKSESTGARSGKMDWRSKGGSFDRKSDSKKHK